MNDLGRSEHLSDDRFCMLPGYFLRVHRIRQYGERTSRLVPELPRPGQTSSGHGAQLLRFLICQGFRPFADVTICRGQPWVYGMFDGKNRFVDGMKLDLVAFYLVDRPSADAIELKAG